MADFADRHPLNVPGRYYTDGTCAACGACHATLTRCIRYDSERCAYYIARQPSTPEEIQLAEECAATCPHEAMGTDGDEFDWGDSVTVPPVPQSPSQERRGWRFW